MTKSLLVIGLEKNPFNDVLFNALIDYGVKVKVIYTVKQGKLSNGTNWKSTDSVKYDYKYLIGLSKLFIFAEIWKSRRSNVQFTGYIFPIFIVAMFFCYLLRIKYIVFTDTIVLKKNVGILKSALRKVARILAYDKSLAVLTTGKIARDELVKYGCSATKIVNYPYVSSGPELLAHASKPLPNETSIYPKSDSRVKILYSGQLIYRKALDNLLYVASLVKKKKARFILYVEGDGPLRASYIELVRKLNLEDCVEFLGFNQSEEHARHLFMSDIVVAPSRWEPWGNIVHEAMLLGKVVIASDAVASAADRIKDGFNGFIYPVDNVAELMFKLESVLDNKNRCELISANARRTAVVWDPVLNAINLLSFLNSVDQ